MPYYFLMASLPSLSWSEPAPLTFSAFRQLCAGQVDPADQAAIEAIEAGHLVPEEGVPHPILFEWSQRDILIRNAIARQRAQRTNRDASAFLRSATIADAGIESAVAAAFSAVNPLAREQALDRLRWSELDSLGGLDSFASAALVAYALKLRIAERWSALDAERGAARAEALLAKADTSKPEQSSP